MNFLAHSYLAGESEGLQIGNFIADSVKGKQVNKFDEEIRQGILLHREIDAFTDHHPIVSRSVTRLYPTQGKYASVVIDIFYDHFLAKDWYKYHPLSLQKYTTYFYNLIERNFDKLPLETQNFFPYMKKEDWLFNYSLIEGIHKAFQGMATRTQYPSNMIYATDDLQTYYTLFEEDFNEFFPELIQFTTQFFN